VDLSDAALKPTRLERKEFAVRNEGAVRRHTCQIKDSRRDAMGSIALPGSHWVT
jgi:hypothetical protein